MTDRPMGRENILKQNLVRVDKIVLQERNLAREQLCVRVSGT
jgi:hypothetical protein